MYYINIRVLYNHTVTCTVQIYDICIIYVRTVAAIEIDDNKI